MAIQGESPDPSPPGDPPLLLRMSDREEGYACKGGGIWVIEYRIGGMAVGRRGRGVSNRGSPKKEEL